MKLLFQFFFKSLPIFQEFLLAFNIRSKGKVDERLTWTFNIYDIDSNGQIDMKELRKMFDMLFTMLNVDKKDEKYSVEKYVNEVITKFDLSGDKKVISTFKYANLNKYSLLNVVYWFLKFSS